MGLWVPEVLADKCTSCGVCLKVCPGYSVDFEQLSSRVFGKAPKGDAMGEFLGCYAGYSTDQSLRFNGASGGLVSQILVWALETGVIDGALVTRMSKSNPLRSESFVARTVGEIVEASRSKYCPVAANDALREIIRGKGRFAVVGLPCHLHGIRKAEQVYPELKKKIVLRLGLMCSHMVSYDGTEFVVRKLHVDRNAVEDIAYRGNGWPGSMTVKSSGKTTRIPLVGNWHSYWPIFSSFLFTPRRCTMCPDQMAEFSDVSFGDAWLPEFRSDKVGRSILVTRTEFAEKLLGTMQSENKIVLSQSTEEKVKLSQDVNLTFKKKDFYARLRLLEALGWSLPVYVPRFSGSLSILALVRAVFILFSLKVSSSRRIVSALTRFPFPLFRLYSGIYRVLSKG
jgi:coenzyme F420 hydrogenase subunit beta